MTECERLRKEYDAAIAEHNAAIANGLWLKARPILRRINALGLALERAENDEASC